MSALSAILSNQDWSCSLSACDLITCSSLILSANFLITVMRWAMASILLMKIRNRIGPNTDPCGDRTFSHPETALFRATLCLLSPSYVLIHLSTLPAMPCTLIWAFNLLCGTLSKALAKSRKKHPSLHSRPLFSSASLRSQVNLWCTIFLPWICVGWISAAHCPVGVSWGCLELLIPAPCSIQRIFWYLLCFWIILKALAAHLHSWAYPNRSKKAIKNFAGLSL